jgi:hypothetical protein
MRISLVGAVGAVALASVLSGCGSSVTGTATPASGSASASSSAATSSAGTATPPTAAALQAAVVQPTELPAGWTGTPHQASPDEAASNAALLKCVGARDTSPDQVNDEHSPDFATSTGSSISSAATSYRSQQDIDDDVAVLTNPKVSGCFTDQMLAVLNSSGLPEGATIGAPRIQITAGSNGGPGNVVAAGTGTIPVTVDGQQITFFLNVAFITGRLTEGEVDFFGIGTPVPADLQSSLVTAVAARVGSL